MKTSDTGNRVPIIERVFNNASRIRILANAWVYRTRIMMCCRLSMPFREKSEGNRAAWGTLNTKFRGRMNFGTDFWEARPMVAGYS